jgi:hypothetical protein
VQGLFARVGLPPVVCPPGIDVLALAPGTLEWALFPLERVDIGLTVSLNLSQFVARQIWGRCSVLPLRYRAHRLQRRGRHRGLLVPMIAIFDLLQTARN